MKILFFGLGSIGLKHARLLMERGGCELFAFRSNRNVQQNALDIPEIYSWHEVDALQADVAFITNPTHLHIETAIECADRNMALFLEKPVGCDTARLNDLMSLVHEKRLPTYVAYVLRFNPVMMELKRLLSGSRIFHARFVCTSYFPNWRPDQDHKESYSAKKSCGGGVILEVSHEFDAIVHLFGQVRSMKGEFGRRADVTVDAEDYVNVAIQTDQTPVNVHLNFLSHKQQRIVCVDTDDGYYEADFINSIVRFNSVSDRWERKIPFERDDMYRNQLNYFLEHVGDSGMMNNIFDAAPLFEEIVKFRNTGPACEFC